MLLGSNPPLVGRPFSLQLQITYVSYYLLLESLGLWTLYIVQNSKYVKTTFRQPDLFPS
jgi:hypothetical protein